LKQVSPRRYQANVPLWGHGRYHAVAQAKGDGRDEQAFGGFIVSYSPEYLRFRSNRQTLSEIAERTGGRMLTGDPKADDVYHADRRVKRTTRPVFDWFLIALACLIPVDVAFRRVQIDWSAIAGLFRRRTGPATATTGALLQRKQQVQSALAGRKEERPLPPPTSAPKPIAPRPTTPTASTPPPPQPSPTGDDQPMSTTERLLRLKKQREENPGDEPKT
jgi:hypothetical protein